MSIKLMAPLYNLIVLNIPNLLWHFAGQVKSQRCDEINLAGAIYRLVLCGLQS